jgi:hypothetical protein
MTQDGLYDWIAHLDCSAQPDEPSGHEWIDAMVARRDNALEAMLRERLQVPPGGDLLDAALNEQWLRGKFNMHDLIAE